MSLWLVLGGVANRRSRRTNAVGVGPVKMNQMLFWFWDVDEHARDKLKWVDRLAVVDIVARFGLINKGASIRDDNEVETDSLARVASSKRGDGVLRSRSRRNRRSLWRKTSSALCVST